MATEVLNRSARNGISVLVSGAGVGGLMAALECWRRGCDVRIFERSKGVVTTGDSFTIGYSAIESFKNWPFLENENERIAYSPLVAYCKENGDVFAGPTDFKEILSEGVTNEKAKIRIYRHSRPKFHRMLHEQLSRIGLEVEFDKEAVEYFDDEEQGRAGVVLKDGSRHDADLVVAADGARGVSWSLVAGQPVPARSSGNAMFRVAFPVEHVLSDPVIAERLKFDESGRSVVNLIFGEGWHAVFWRNEDEIQFGIQHKDDGTADEHWGHKVQADEVLKFTSSIPEWNPIFDRVIKATPQDSIVDYKLMWRDPQPKWTSPSGRVVQLGDAAHTFLPSSGNGGTQALEDAISLATCISIAGKKEKVPEATRVHNLLRFERCSCLQAFGVVNRQKQNTAKKDSEQGKKILHMGKWIVDHNAEEYALGNYEQALAHLQDPEKVPFQNTNGPPDLKYRPWTIDSLLESQRKGEPTVLDADWS